MERCASTWSAPSCASSSRTKMAVSSQYGLCETASTMRPRARSLSATLAAGRARLARVPPVWSSGRYNRTNDGNSKSAPSFVLLYLPDDHTGGTRANRARPAANVADNDLALGRIVDAVSHSPYWDDTAILVLEDD